ncbi:serine/threonine-protein phosphatase 4 regulatory subunit 2-B isoform X2 [Quercus lobata]|uniref:serine/threonine-protein phosphatase 4 regulatory subunit 2-B isoform X2 n=1 Tax=Quercus lobata TaxID=97700 RepID=UPI001248FCE5|nr:serine/threonine-protein phosphatase 4 regulatory subunit 2-B isoform X2 [Quercus lobata]
MMEETPSNENSEEHSITPPPPPPPPPNDATPTAVAVAVADADADADADANADHHHHENTVPDPINPGGVELKAEIAEEEADEVKGILEVIASTGKFWHDWDKLKSMLSFQLKQVLSEYPEAKMTSEEQNASLGETYLELVKRLDEALLGFVEGPPFTLQRLCEILLEARTIYPNLSKLGLALEKVQALIADTSCKKNVGSRDCSQTTPSRNLVGSGSALEFVGDVYVKQIY